MESMEINEQKTSPSSQVFLGEYLEKNRNKHNMTLEKLAQKTKISINILKALESNNFEKLPSAAYIKGFVKTYIKIFDLSEEEAFNKMEMTYLTLLGKSFPALDHTKRLKSSPHPSLSITSHSSHDIADLNKKKFAFKGKPVILSAILIFLILTSYFGYQLISTIINQEATHQSRASKDDKSLSEASLITSRNSSETSSNKTTLTDETDGAGEREESKAEVNDALSTSSNTKQESNEEKSIKNQIPRNYPPVQFKPIRGKLFSFASVEMNSEFADVLPQKIRDQMNPDIQNIYINAQDGDTWLSYKIDDAPIESAIIKKGKDLFLQGSEIRVFLGNVTITKIFYNNRLINTPTKSGVKSLVFPEESHRKFMLPLFPKATDDVLYTSREYMKRMKIEEESERR